MVRPGIEAANFNGEWGGGGVGGYYAVKCPHAHTLNPLNFFR